MIKAIIIDDEYESRNTIHNILKNFCPNVKVIGQAENVSQGVSIINDHPPNILFLDIQMPDGNGFDLLEKLPLVNFKVVFVTAFDEYALKAIKFSALDYILKPIDPQQILDAVNKFESSESEIQHLTSKISTLLRNKNGFERIALPTFEGFKFIDIKDIIRCESDSNYTTIYLNTGEKVLVTRTLKEYEEILSDMDFIRIHQSHLINIRYVDRYIKGDGGNVIMVDGSNVEVSRRKKEEFLIKLIK